MLMELGQKNLGLPGPIGYVEDIEIFGRSLRSHFFFDIMVASSVALTNQQ